jgi:hypothetical protein
LKTNSLVNPSMTVLAIGNGMMLTRWQLLTRYEYWR